MLFIAMPNRSELPPQQQGAQSENEAAVWSARIQVWRQENPDRYRTLTNRGKSQANAWAISDRVRRANALQIITAQTSRDMAMHQQLLAIQTQLNPGSRNIQITISIEHMVENAAMNERLGEMSPEDQAMVQQRQMELQRWMTQSAPQYSEEDADPPPEYTQ